MDKYQVIYADPPRHFGASIPSTKGSKDGNIVYSDRTLEEWQYSTMKAPELREFFAGPVKDMADDTAVLVM